MSSRGFPLQTEHELWVWILSAMAGERDTDPNGVERPGLDYPAPVMVNGLCGLLRDCQSEKMASQIVCRAACDRVWRAVDRLWSGNSDSYFARAGLYAPRRRRVRTFIQQTAERSA